MEIAATFFNILSPGVIYLLISKGVHVPPRPQNETNHGGNHSPPLVINTAVETEMNTRTTKVMVQPVSGSQNLRTFMIMLG